MASRESLQIKVLGFFSVILGLYMTIHTSARTFNRIKTEYFPLYFCNRRQLKANLLCKTRQRIIDTNAYHCIKNGVSEFSRSSLNQH